MMKINLVNPNFKETIKMPPLILGYIASLLKDRHDVSIVDFSIGDRLKEADVNIAITDYDYFNCPMLSFDYIDSFLTELKNKNVPLVVMGPHATTDPKRFQKFADFMVIGEPEYTVKELIESWNKEKKGIKGLYHLKGSKYHMNPPRGLLKNLDALPFPARELMKIKKYTNPLNKRNPYTTVISSRGCPYRCTYCYNEVYGHSWRARSSENVLAELKHIRNDLKIKEVCFIDDLFTLDKKRIINICDGIINSRLDLTWSAQSRLDLVDSELAQKMRKAGCHLLSFGIESGSQIILDRLKKGIKKERVKCTTKYCKEAGIKTRGYFIVGSPFETEKTLKETEEFAKELDLDYFNISIMTPYPGTELYKENINKNRKFVNIGGVKTKFTLDELLKVKRKMYLHYYLSRKYLMNRVLERKFKVLFNGFYPFARQILTKRFRGQEL